MADLVESGRNWSGNERNVAFLNTADGKFAGVSALLGFDSPADGRGMALVDWDGDGDQDVWITQRNAPRLRFLRNDNHSKGNAIRIKLNDPTGNRSAIGARVTLTDSKGGKQIRTLRAGEGYLSQSSLSLHFGIGQADHAKSIQIRWPDSSMSQYAMVRKGHWIAEKGKSNLQHYQQRQKARPASESVESLQPRQITSRRIIPHSPLKVPNIPYLETNGNPSSIKTSNKRQLLVFWATWCVPCIQELSTLQSHKETLAESGLEIFAMNVDDLKEPVNQRNVALRRFFRKQSWDFKSGLATRDTLEVMDAIREVILGRQWTWSIPCSLLLDESGQAIAVYEGSPSMAQLVKDTQTLFNTGPDRNHAVPYTGQWYQAHYPPDRLAIGEVLSEKNMFEELDSYLAKIETSEVLLPEKAGYISSQAGILAAKMSVSLGMNLLDHALRFEPDHSEHAYAKAVLQQSSKDYSRAILSYESILRKDPSHIRATAALALMLAATPDETMRDPQRALELAEKACQLTQFQAPEALDVLATAYASSGQFSKAIQTAKSALELLPAESRKSSPIRGRLDLFHQQKAFFLDR